MKILSEIKIFIFLQKTALKKSRAHVSGRQLVLKHLGHGNVALPQRFAYSSWV